MSIKDRIIQNLEDQLIDELVKKGHVTIKGIGTFRESEGNVLFGASIEFLQKLHERKAK